MLLRSHYFEDPSAKTAFKVFAREIFGLDFAPWESRGLWDDAYVPYSIFDGKTVVANMCVYPSDMTVGGTPRSGLQLLTVGTLPAYRKRGLQRKIWEAITANEVAHHDFVFLFTKSAAGIYEKLGLVRQPEFFHRLTLPAASTATRSNCIRLDPAKPADFSRLKALAHERLPVSQRLGFYNPNLLLFMLIAPYRNWLYHLPDQDIVIVAEEVDDAVRIHDILGRSNPDKPSIERFLTCFGKPKVDILFPPDQLGFTSLDDLPLTEDTLMTSPDFEMPGKTLFPFSIRA